MLLRVKSLNLSTGRPVAILHEKTAKKLAVYVGERIKIKNKQSIIAVVDIANGILKENEIALSSEIINALNISKGHAVEVTIAPPPKTICYILKKLNGEKLSCNELFSIVSDIVNNSLTEAELAYFISGVYIHGMSDKEIADLTKAMVSFGKKLEIDNIVYDKHSIGGVAGNRTTPLIVSICSSAGVIIPKTSSRAITSAAGTADVIECFANVEFDIKEIKKIIQKTNGCMVWGGALKLAPADDKIIQVERILSLDPEAQLIASILAKKLAVRAKGVLLDIPYGNSAKVKTKSDAVRLKERFQKIAKILKLNIKAVLTDGSQPIGNGIGPVLEARDVLSVLKQEKSRPLDLEKKALYLSSLLLEMSGKAKKGQGIKMASEILKSGMAYQKFKHIIEAQGGTLKDINKKLQLAKLSFAIKAEKSGKIKEIDNKKISAIARAAGCPSDKAAGVFLHVHLNDKIEKNQNLMIIYAETKEKLNFAKKVYQRLKPILLV
ncbi:MAG: AMP phosphorylase [Candidatus Pacearchaeota archaeon]